MTYLEPDDGSKWPRLEVETVAGEIVFTIWKDADTQGARFVARTQQDIEIIYIAACVGRGRPRGKT